MNPIQRRRMALPARLTVMATSTLLAGLFSLSTLATESPPPDALDESPPPAGSGHGARPDESPPPEALLEAIARDMGWAKPDIAGILDAEHHLVDAAIAAERSLGEHYGGSWIERDERGFPRLVVAGTTTDAASARLEAISAASAGLSVEFRPVRYSLRELEATVEAFDLAATGPLARDLDGIHSWGIDLAGNQVVIVTAPEVDQRVIDFFATSRADLDRVRFEVSDHPPSTLADIIGGLRYNSCSIGFAVRRGTTPGFVTAGHCGSVGTIVRIGGVAVGSFQRSNFPGADAAWANVRSSDRLFNRVWQYSGSSTYPVTGSSEAPLGATVCRSGFRTGWRCGTLTRNNVTVNYSGGNVVNGLRESNACAGQGDSGGSWVAGGNQAQGVTSGGALGGDGTNCGIAQNQRRTWFQRLNPMLNSYGLSLVTN